MKGRKKEKKNVKKESDANEYLNFLTQGKVLLLIISQIPPLLLEKITYLPKKKNPKTQKPNKNKNYNNNNKKPTMLLLSVSSVCWPVYAND